MIIKSFTNNEKRFKEGIHFFNLEGLELRELKMVLDNNNLQSVKISDLLILWTERGVARVAKTIEMEKAWYAYEDLEETYFRFTQNVTLKVKDGNLIEDQKQKGIKKLKCNTAYLDDILSSNERISILQLSQDYGVSAIKMNALLYGFKVQQKKGEQWVLCDKYKNKNYGYESITNLKNEIIIEWTQEGRVLLYNLLKSKGLLPMIEQN